MSSGRRGWPLFGRWGWALSSGFCGSRLGWIGLLALVWCSVRGTWRGGFGEEVVDGECFMWGKIEGREKREDGITNIPSIILLVTSLGILFPKEGLVHCSVDRLHRVSSRVPDPGSKGINSKGWSCILQVEKLLERYCTRTISLWRVIWEW